jgi:CheY-like chemotaxis protein
MTQLNDHSSQPFGKRAPLLCEVRRVRACDLYRVFSRAADEAATAAFAGGLALVLQFDPALREARLACPTTVARVVRTTIAAMLRMTRRGAVTLCAGIGRNGDNVTMTVSSHLEPTISPDAHLFSRAAEQARELGGRLIVDRQEARLMLSLVFPAVLSPMMVLLIERDWIGRRQSVRTLEEAGFHVELAEDGEAALRASSGAAYVAVLADLYLENDDALALVARLRDANGAAPVFALTREGADTAGWALAKAGFAGLVKSPVSAAALRTALASVEAAELEAVQAGENAQEDGNGQDRDHGRTGSENLRSA